MTRITNQVVDPGTGAPVPGVRVVAELVAPAAWLNNQSEVSGRVEADTDANGVYFLNLIPQSDYELPGTYYKIREWEIATWYVSVPSADLINSTVAVRDILVNPSPDAVPWSPISTFDTLRDVNPVDRSVGDILAVGQDGKLGYFPPSAAVSAPNWWSGDGPPPDVIVGASPHDLYYDRLTGDVYILE